MDTLLYILESDVIFKSLNRSEKLDDYCLCRHISTLDCTSMEDLDDCTTLCNETEGGDSEYVNDITEGDVPELI